MPSGFSDSDSVNLTNVCRDVKWMKDQYEKQMDEIIGRQTSGERRLHERVDEVHSRVNKVRNLFIGFSTFLSILGGIIGAWIRVQLK